MIPAVCALCGALRTTDRLTRIPHTAPTPAPIAHRCSDVPACRSRIAARITAERAA